MILPVLYEDEWLFVVDKPAGMLVHSVARASDDGGVDALAIAAEMRPNDALALAHRLDRETSGVLVLTKGARADRILKRAFADRRVQKAYVAIVHGCPSWETFTCDVPLGRAWDAELTIRRRADVEGEPAVSRFEVLARLGDPGRVEGPTAARWTLVRCTPETGRTHQLRAHLAHLGHPILGDKLYGQPDAVFLEHQRKGATANVRACVVFPRQALHAGAITLPHPATGAALTVEAPMPADMAAIVAGGAPGWD